MAIRGYHAHIYFDPDEVDHARAVAAAAQTEVGCPIGHFHTALLVAAAVCLAAGATAWATVGSTPEKRKAAEA